MTTFNVSGGSAHSLLTQALRHLLTSEFPQTQVRLFHCDSDAEDRFVRFAGLARARWALFDQCERAEHPSPTLAIGLLPLPYRGAVDGMPWLGPLLDWPGFAYLPYGFTKEELLVSTRSVVEGAKTPIPSGLLPTPGDVLYVISENRHWLNNRRKNVELALDDFAPAALGGGGLHPSHLEPVVAISDAHRRMLGLLWALEPAALRFAPTTGGLAPMKTAIAEFETCWMELELRREALRSDKVFNDSQRLAEMAQALKTVVRAIDSAIATSLALDVELNARMVT